MDEPILTLYFDYRLSNIFTFKQALVGGGGIFDTFGFIKPEHDQALIYPFAYLGVGFFHTGEKISG